MSEDARKWGVKEHTADNYDWCNTSQSDLTLKKPNCDTNIHHGSPDFMQHQKATEDSLSVGTHNGDCCDVFRVHVTDLKCSIINQSDEPSS
jgi:hypothetical protein